MSHRLWANRGDEIALFDRMVAGESEACILLIESEGGMGKSTLLREYERRYRPVIACVPVDLKGKLGLADAFHLLGRGVAWSYLPTFHERIMQMAQPERVNVAKNWVIGRSEIQVALQSPDEETRRFRLAALTDAFFADLAVLDRRVVFMFDTVDDAGPGVQDWLMGPFLGHVRYCGNVVAVVASRPPLEEYTTWSARCEYIHLQGITDPEDWHVGLQDWDPSFHVSREWIQAYCVCFDGHPLGMRNALEKVILAYRRAEHRGGDQ